jgi:hypothetical protein
MARAALEERETVLNLNAQDRVNGGTWLVFSDDPAMITRLKRAVQPHKDNGHGGYWFNLPVESVSFRKPLTAEQKRVRASRVKSLNSPTDGILGSKQAVLVRE